MVNKCLMLFCSAHKPNGASHVQQQLPNMSGLQQCMPSIDMPLLVDSADQFGMDSDDLVPTLPVCIPLSSPWHSSISQCSSIIRCVSKKFTHFLMITFPNVNQFHTVLGLTNIWFLFTFHCCIVLDFFLHSEHSESLLFFYSIISVICT